MFKFDIPLNSTICYSHNLLFHWTQPKRNPIYSISSVPVMSADIAQHLVWFKVVCEPWKVLQQCLYKFSFWWRLRCAPFIIMVPSLESRSFSCLIWLLFRWFSCFCWQKCSDIYNMSNHMWQIITDLRFKMADKRFFDSIASCVCH